MSANSDTAAADGETEHSRAELLTQLELLSEENDRLRDSVERAKRTQYRRTALGLAVVGSVAVVAGLVVTQASTVLFALGGTGLFGAVLTYYLTPETFVAADVGRDVYADLATNHAALADELGLTDRRVYVPVETAEGPARLFVPQFDDYDLPDEETLARRTVVSDDDATRGLALTPSAGRLFDATTAALTGTLAETPDELTAQLTDALVEQFELVRSARVDSDPDGGRLSVGVSGSVYGSPEQFDHPVVSFLAVGVAAGLDEPVTATVTAVADGRADYRITLRWGGEQ